MPKTFSCPFWSWESGLKLYCECCRLDFPDRETRGDYTDRYCANNPGWQGCTVARALCRQYERTPLGGTASPLGGTASPLDTK